MGENETQSGDMFYGRFLVDHNGLLCLEAGNKIVIDV
jgi:hypothetical protein